MLPSAPRDRRVSTNETSQADRAPRGVIHSIHLPIPSEGELFMKSSPKVLLLFAAALVATAAQAQYGSTPIKHVVVIFQENRTPDNLFQGLCTANGAVPGCNATGTPGTYDIASAYMNADGQTLPLTPVGLATNFDLDHSHGGPKLNGTISGFNFEYQNQGISGKPAANVPAGCGANIFGCVVPANNYSQFMYVYNSPVTNSNGSRGGVLDPYITLAETYGWGNRMFQTNQGPSYPAHQFMFSGTSALSATADTNSTFVSENFTAAPNTSGPANSGCLTQNGAFSDILSPNLTGTCPSGCNCFNGNTVQECKQTNVLNMTTAVGTFCVLPPSSGGHSSMGQLLENPPNGAPAISWKYYSPGDGSIWNAPNAIDAICQPEFNPNPPPTLICGGNDYAKHVDTKNLGTDILTDI